VYQTEYGCSAQYGTRNGAWGWVGWRGEFTEDGAVEIWKVSRHHVTASPGLLSREKNKTPVGRCEMSGRRTAGRPAVYLTQYGEAGYC